MMSQINHRRTTRSLAWLSILLAGSLIGNPYAIAHDGEDHDEDDPPVPVNCDISNPSACGEKSGLVPFHKDAIHASLIWKEGEDECPDMLIAMRATEYTPNQVLNPTEGGVFSGFNPKYQEFVQGGFSLGPLDRSTWSRYAPDIDRENTQLINVCGLQDLVDTGVFTKSTIPELTNADMALTDPYFTDAGYSKGLNYNLFCTGLVTGTDSRIYAFGIHDKGGNNGGRKVNIYDPETETWVDRPVPCVKEDFELDPTGTMIDHCSALIEDNTDPADPSDMRYQRWYATSVTLPDGKILALSGSDQDTSAGPDHADETKVRQATPEVYDPVTDKTIALENARKLLAMYPRAYVVQTGPKQNDWKVCVAGEAAFVPVNMGPYDPFTYNGNTSCLDVQAALADPNRNVPGENHWQLIDVAADGHDSGASVMQVTINDDGTWKQEVTIFGGSSGRGTQRVAIVEKINYADPQPKWVRQSDLILPANQNNAVALPDGKVLVVGGRGTFNYQMYNPHTGSITKLMESSVPRHDHATALLLPTGGIWIMGGNRTDLLPRDQENQAVPVMEHYKPPYFFKGTRPAITNAPDKINYNGTFKVAYTGSASSVVLMRTGPITHNWAWGNHSVSLPIKKLKNKEKKTALEVKAPHLPGLAVAGDYILFVVDENGVPSEGKRVHLTWNLNSPLK